LEPCSRGAERPEWTWGRGSFQRCDMQGQESAVQLRERQGQERIEDAVKAGGQAQERRWNGIDVRKQAKRLIEVRSCPARALDRLEIDIYEMGAMQGVIDTVLALEGDYEALLRSLCEDFMFLIDDMKKALAERLGGTDRIYPPEEWEGLIESVNELGERLDERSIIFMGEEPLICRKDADQEA